MRVCCSDPGEFPSGPQGQRLGTTGVVQPLHRAPVLPQVVHVGRWSASSWRPRRSVAERRDFHLLVDEFQHFANDVVGTILSAARKFRLSLTLSHQYLDQLPPPISDVVFGNAGTLCVFRVGASDTARLVRELAPSFDAQDLVHLPNHRFCARVNRGGEALPAFSAQTVPLPETTGDSQSLIEQSRRRWARPRAEVELEIADLWEGRAG
jgi:hypothetical protein